MIPLLLPIAFLLVLLPYVTCLLPPGRMLPHLLIFLTILCFLALFYRAATLCFTSSLSKKLNRRQRWVVFLALIIALGMVICPPWIITEEILPDEAPPRVWPTTMPFGPVVSLSYSPAAPVYGDPTVSYQPMYMGFYSASRRWFDPSTRATGPLPFGPPRPLGRKPKNAEEEFYCKYICPTRTVELCAGRLGAQLGVLILLGGVLFWLFTEKGQFTQTPSGGGGEDGGTWLVVGPEDFQAKP